VVRPYANLNLAETNTRSEAGAGHRICDLAKPVKILPSPDRDTNELGSDANIHDTSCLLFGYYGLTNGEKAFSFDHMFGF